MTREEMFDQFETLTCRMLAMMKAKNNDYTAGADPFRNFNRHGEYGIIVRMGDKMSRLESFTDPARQVLAKVKDESFEDTAVDLANYALLLILLRRKNEQERSASREAAL